MVRPLRVEHGVDFVEALVFGKVVIHKKMMLVDAQWPDQILAKKAVQRFVQAVVFLRFSEQSKQQSAAGAKIATDKDQVAHGVRANIRLTFVEKSTNPAYLGFSWRLNLTALLMHIR